MHFIPKYLKIWLKSKQTNQKVTKHAMVTLSYKDSLGSMLLLSTRVSEPFLCCINPLELYPRQGVCIFLNPSTCLICESDRSLLYVQASWEENEKRGPLYGKFYKEMPLWNTFRMIHLFIVPIFYLFLEKRQSLCSNRILYYQWKNLSNMVFPQNASGRYRV